MKTKLLAFVVSSFAVALASAYSPSASAVDVVLDSDWIELPSADARLIRTAATPKKVRLSVPVEMSRRYCAVTNTRVVEGRNGARCGWDHDYAYDCFYDRVCGPGPRGRIYCSRFYTCGNRMIGIPRYCSWEVEECERYDTETRPEIREVTLKFKRMARLRDGETETYELVSSQVRTGKDEAAYRLKAVDTKRPVKIVARDGLFTLFEDVISVRGKKKN